MAAPSIPNLLSLRGRGGSGGSGGVGRGLRSRGGRGRGHAPANSASGQSDDLAIQGTDTDAAVSRLSAVDLGYLDDPYARYFVSAIDGLPARRFPIINRGTYTRTTAIDGLIASFLTDDGGSSSSSSNSVSPGQKQIVSLGSGTDTRPFRFFNQQSHPNLIYHEIDFTVTSSKKLKTVEAAPSLANILTNRTPGDNGSWTSLPSTGGKYHSHGLDIRNLSLKVNEPLPGLRTDIPTLLLSECCLCYLSQDESERILHYFSSRISSLAVIIYEPVHLGDAFSDTMTSNLAARNIHMPGLEQCRNQRDQEVRLQKSGFTAIHHMTIDAIWDRWVAVEEKERVDRLEGLDEVEEWKLLAGHYIVVWGSKGDGLGSLPAIKTTN